VIGEVPGVSNGDKFANRQALHDAGVHAGTQGGIGGGGNSIVQSGGYVDDRDDGDLVIYTGQGGRDPNSGRQIADQALTRGNKQLAHHYNSGNPIRVRSLRHCLIITL
jgi:putative restriction endonuclease